MSAAIETAKARLKLELNFIVLLCVAALFVELLAAGSVFEPASEAAPLWFQRSGAITSIFCIFAQLRINNFLESIRGGTFRESWVLFDLFKKRHSIISWAITLFAIQGAIVLGYGDLMFQYFIH